MALTTSLTTVTKTDAWVARHPHDTTWAELDSEQKQQCVDLAIVLVSTGFYWRGTPVTNGCAWPRSGLTDDKGQVLDSGTIPQQITDATSEMARQLAATDYSADSTLEALSIASAGDTSFSNPRVRHIVDLTAMLVPDHWHNGLRLPNRGATVIQLERT